MNAMAFQPYRNTTIAICLLCLGLAFSYQLGKLQILGRLVHAIYKAIVTTAGYLEKSTHLADTVFVLVTIDNSILDLRSHFLSVSERKSRISSFSISRALILASLRAMMYFSSLTLSVLENLLSLGGRPFFFSAIPASIFR